MTFRICNVGRTCGFCKHLFLFPRFCACNNTRIAHFVITTIVNPTTKTKLLPPGSHVFSSLARVGVLRLKWLLCQFPHPEDFLPITIEYFVCHTEDNHPSCLTALNKACQHFQRQLIYSCYSYPEKKNK